RREDERASRGLLPGRFRPRLSRSRSELRRADGVRLRVSAGWQVLLRRVGAGSRAGVRGLQGARRGRRLGCSAFALRRPPRPEIGEKTNVRLADYYPDASDLGYHALAPNYDEQMEYDCEYLPGGKCYYDGSGLAAEPVFEDFKVRGEVAVWDALRSRYEDLPDPRSARRRTCVSRTTTRTLPTSAITLSLRTTTSRWSTTASICRVASATTTGRGWQPSRCSRTSRCAARSPSGMLCVRATKTSPTRRSSPHKRLTIYTFTTPAREPREGVARPGGG